MTVNRVVVGSSPTRSAIFYFLEKYLLGKQLIWNLNISSGNELRIIIFKCINIFIKKLWNMELRKD